MVSDFEPTVRRRGQRWGRVAAAVLTNPGLTMQAKAVYALLATYADDTSRECHPRQQTLAEQLGCSIDTVQRKLTELIDAGLVEVHPRFRGDGGQSHNDYVLTDDLAGSSTAPMRSQGRTHAVKQGRTHAVAREHNQIEHNQITPTPPPPSEPLSLFVVPVDTLPAPVALDDAFDQWWSLWPKKRDKGHARKAYERAARKVGTQVLYDAVLVQLGALKQDEQRGGFCPLPATWLNGERWDDDRSSTPVNCSNGVNVAAHLLAQDLAGQVALTGSWDA